MLVRRACVAASIAFAISGSAFAQSHRQQDEVFVYVNPHDRLGFDVQGFEPSTSPRSITTVDLATIPGHLSFTLGAWTSYASNPLVYDDAGGTTHPIVGSLWQTEVHASLGLFEYMELGFALPVVYTTHVGLNAAESDLALGTCGNSTSLCGDARIGDLRAYVKVPILRGSWPLAVRLGASFPFPGDAGGDRTFAGNLAWTVTPTVMMSHVFGPLTAAVNLGYRLRERNGLAGGQPFVLDDEVVWSAGARYDVTHRVGINAEILGRVGVSEGAFVGNRNPVEIDGGGTFQLTDAMSVQVGGGRGLTSGYSSPEFRVFGGLRYTVTRARCSQGPEDYDGFQDGDFCNDPDNDNDGIPDAQDRCPNDPEDRDGFLDEDGCPDPDNDADGIPDDVDRCPMDPEDHDGFEDNDGCPEGDNDRDGVPDAVDQCPNDPEDLDGYQDEDGCPEPGPEAVVVTRTESHLLLSQRIFFDYDSDTIRSVSLPILSEVARTLRANPDITRVRIEGYTDGQGDPQYNLDLSYRRARAVVEYLASQGVARDHLEFQGYGQQHPVADDHMPEGQALNRRVEFTIMGQAGSHVSAPSTTPSGGGPAGGDRRRHRHEH